MNIHEVVTKLTGPIDPVGESHTDKWRFTNLEKLIELTDKLVGDIQRVSFNKNRQEASMKKSGERCAEFLADVQDCDRY